MAFRILHTSDWHLGQNFYGKNRLNEHQQFIAWLLEQIQSHQVDAVVVAGDIFDTGTPPSYARELYFDFVVKLHALNCKSVILAGNHDSVAMIGESASVLAQLGCTVIAKATSYDEDPNQLVWLENMQGEQAVVCAIPFIRPRDVQISSAGQSATEKQQQLQRDIANHFQQLVVEAKEKRAEQCAVIATGHLTAVGVTCSDSVRDIYIGTLEAFPASAFPDVDYIALGHIHRAQIVAKKEHIRYSGSPIPLSFDESSQDKSLNIVTFEQGQRQSVESIIIPSFQPMAQLKTTLADLEYDIDKILSEVSLNDDQTLWLDVELSSSDYLHDLTQRVTSATENFPVEVLLVRRSKNKESSQFKADNTTLDELTIHDVFNARLAVEPWVSEEDIERKPRIEQLFCEVVEQCQHPISDKESEIER